MSKIGRNDPCPCGSQQKYKRCCLEKDKQNNVIRVAFPQHGTLETNPVTSPSHLDTPQKDLLSLIEEELQWSSEQYKSIAKNLVTNLLTTYGFQATQDALFLWNSYTLSTQPLIKKEAICLAAMEYCVAQFIENQHVTQVALAKKYGVSAASISQRVNMIMNESTNFFAYDAEEHQDHFPPINRMSAEQELYAITKMIEGKNFDSLDDLNSYLQQVMSQPRPALKKEEGAPKERANDLVYEAWNEKNPNKQMQLVERARQLDPDHPDVYNIYAQFAAQNIHEMMEYYKKGIKAGERSLGQAFFMKNKGSFWGLVETRPYMRSRYGYAECLLLTRKTQQAIEEFEQLLELNPYDNQGARYLLLAGYFTRKQYQKAGQLMEAYHDEQSTFFAYNKVLLEYGQNGLSARLLPLLIEAYKHNRFVPDYLLRIKQIPFDPPEFYSLGDPNEAVEYAKDFIPIWQKEPRLINWLKATLPTLKR